MVENPLLQNLLQEELSLLEEIYNLSLKKTKSIMNDDLDSLEKIVLKEEALSKKLKISDAACSKQVQFFLEGQTNEALIPAGTRELIDKIKTTVRDLQLNNKLNTDLISDSLALIQFTINSLCSINENSAGLYEPSGKMTGQKQNYLVDYKG